MWVSIKALALFLMILRFRIKFTLSSKKLSHLNIYNSQINSDYGLITYFREGFPRVLGEYMYCNTEPIIWSFSKFGNEEIKQIYKFAEIKDIISVLTSNEKDKFLIKNDSVHNSILKIDERIKKILNNSKLITLRRNLKIFPAEVKNIIIYTLLTADLSYLQQFNIRSKK